MTVASPDGNSGKYAFGCASDSYYAFINATYNAGAPQVSIWPNASNFGLLVDNSYNVGIGVSAFGSSATNVLGITADGTVPSSSPAGMIQIYADDSSDGSANATVCFRTEQEVETSASTPDRRLQIYINGTEYYLPLEAV